MEEISKKVAYLKGLAEGLELSDATAEGKILIKIMDILEDMADEIEELSAASDDALDYIEELDEDLSLLEDDFYDDDDEYDDDDDDIEYYEIECPNCHETVCIDEDFLVDDEDELRCPNCNEVISLDIDCEGCDAKSCENCDK